MTRHRFAACRPPRGFRFLAALRRRRPLITALLTAALALGPGSAWGQAVVEAEPASPASAAPTAPNAASDRPETPTARADAFDGAAAYAHLQAICALGPRISGSEGMRRQQEMVQRHFTQLGAKVSFQEAPPRRHPLTGERVPIANLIAEWDPQAEERLLLCAHYDTRPLPDQDPDPVQRRQGQFLGANDGASGVALLMELGRCLPPGRLGVDFVLFDAEEFVWEERPDAYFVGSTHFAREYRRQALGRRYVAGVLLDMVGDRRLSVYQESYSATWSDTRPIVREIWAAAAQLGVEEFVPRVGYQVKDDHLPLRQIGRIPVCDVIDFHYPDRTNRYWHTTADVPENCSAESLEKVGRVIRLWLEQRRSAE